uniref:Uncharacterized protein n=1 Tax=Eptatretus burgeri TaxID=7764 RepID=A0A8C4NLT0_EPTBU
MESLEPPLSMKDKQKQEEGSRHRFKRRKRSKTKCIASLDDRSHHVQHINSNSHAFESNCLHLMKAQKIGEKFNCSSIQGDKATNDLLMNEKKSTNILSHPLDDVVSLLQQPSRKMRNCESADCLDQQFEAFIQTRGDMQVSDDSSVKDIKRLRKIERFKRARRRLKLKKKKEAKKIRKSKHLDYSTVEKANPSCKDSRVYDSLCEVKTVTKKKSMIKKKLDSSATDFTDGDRTEIYGQKDECVNAEIFGIPFEFSLASCQDGSKEHAADVLVDVKAQVQVYFVDKTQQSQCDVWFPLYDKFHLMQSCTSSAEEKTSSADGDEQYCQSGATQSEGDSLSLIRTDLNKPSNVAGYERPRRSQDLTYSPNRIETLDGFEGSKRVRSQNLAEDVAFSSEAKKEEHIPIASVVDPPEKIVSTPKMAPCSATNRVSISPVTPAKDTVQTTEFAFTRTKQVDSPRRTRIKCEQPRVIKRCKNCWVMVKRMDKCPLTVQVGENTTKETFVCTNYINAVLSVQVGAQRDDHFTIPQILNDLDKNDSSEVKHACHLTLRNPQMQQQHLLCSLPNDNTTEEIARDSEQQHPFDQTRLPKEEDYELNNVGSTASETLCEHSRTNKARPDDNGMFTVEETTRVPSLLASNSPPVCVENVSGYQLRKRDTGCKKTTAGWKCTKACCCALCRKSNGGKVIPTRKVKGTGDGHWTSSELRLLKTIRLSVLSHTDSLNEDLQHNRKFPWKDIARNVKTRNQGQCLQKCLYEVKDSESFEWESISSQFCGVPPVILQNKFYHLKDYHVPTWRFKTFLGENGMLPHEVFGKQESVELLHDRILPKWEEQRRRVLSSNKRDGDCSFDSKVCSSKRV